MKLKKNFIKTLKSLKTYMRKIPIPIILPYRAHFLEMFNARSKCCVTAEEKFHFFLDNFYMYI